MNTRTLITALQAFLWLALILALASDSCNFSGMCYNDNRRDVHGRFSIL